MCVLPNHWHTLIRTADLKLTCKDAGVLHGSASHAWNRSENATGRKVFFGCADRRIRSDAHIYATLNYIYNNPVHHGYVEKWQQWPFSSAVKYLETVGHAEAQRTWQTYPTHDYGKGWDDPSL